MAQYVVVQADPLPVLDGDPVNFAVYRVNALTADLAAVVVATAKRSADPVVLQVIPATQVSRYTVSPTPNFAAVLV
jgi:fructose/tagatose bisphosphate aldolase